MTRFGSKPEYVLAPVLFAGMVVIWETSVRLLNIPAYIVPPPSRIVAALWRGLWVPLLSREGYYVHFGFTFAEAVLGFILGSAAGLVLGAVISQAPLVERTLLPYIVAFQSLPKVAVAPLLVIWFGFGISSKVVICSLLTFFPLMVNTMAGLKAVESERLELMRSLSASRWDAFRKVQFPSALPFVFAGLHMAIVYSVIGAIVGEFVGAQRGLGVVLMQSNFAMDIAGVFAIFIILSVMGIVLHLFMRWFHRKVLFWAPENQQITGA